MAFNNGNWKFGSDSAEGDVFDMGQQPIWSVADNYNAGGGDDHVKGNIADNVIDGGDGADTIDGWWGNDTIHGGHGQDTLKGDLGDDKLYGEAGSDDIDGGWGNDYIDGGSNSDNLKGDLGNDTIDGGNDNDKLYGDTGADTLFGGQGHDTLDGGEGADSLDGGSGSDSLFDGSSENVVDTMKGGDGNDYLESLGGGDIMSGGADSDTFSIGNANSFRQLGGTISGGTGYDTVVLRDAGLVDNFSNMSSIEAFDLRDADNQTLRLDVSEVKNLSSTDKLTVYGEAGDKLELQNDVPGSRQSGGHWELATPTVSTDGTPSMDVYNYVDANGHATGISVSVDDHVEVVLI
jgi:Ca2+-binding RTX toxin-like protein